MSKVVTFTAGMQPTAAQLDLTLPDVVVKSANETVNNTTTLQNDDELLLTVAANATYEFDLELYYFSGATPDLKIAWTFPTGLTMTWGGVYYDAALAVTTNGNFSQTAVLPLGGTGGDAKARLSGRVVVSSTAGTLQLQWAQNTLNASNSTIYAGSWFSMTRVA